MDDLRPGMVLGADAVDAAGRTLLFAGTVLTGDNIAALRARGLAAVEVRGAGALEPGLPEDPVLMANALEGAADYASRFFQYADPGHEAVLELFRLTVDRLALKMAGGWRPPDRLDERLPDPGKLELDQFLRDEGSCEDLVRLETQLSSLPDVYYRIMEVLQSSASSVAVIADVIGKDPSLSAKLLKLVNSAFYGFPSKVDAIPRAVMIIGVAELSMLAVGVSAIQVFAGIPAELVDMKEFWRHSIACGVLARNLSLRMRGLSPERLFAGGLLHDIGRLVIFRSLPQAATQALLFSRFNSLPYFEAEKDVLGFDHARVGAMLMTEWKYPPALSNIVKYHHNPAAASSIVEPAVAHVANAMAVVMDIARGAMVHFPGIQDQAWKALGLGEEVLGEILSQSERQVDEIVRIFLE